MTWDMGYQVASDIGFSYNRHATPGTPVEGPKVGTHGPSSRCQSRLPPVGGARPPCGWRQVG